MGIYGRIKAWIKEVTKEDELKYLNDMQLKDARINPYDVLSGLKTRGYGS